MTSSCSTIPVRVELSAGGQHDEVAAPAIVDEQDVLAGREHPGHEVLRTPVGRPRSGFRTTAHMIPATVPAPGRSAAGTATASGA